MGLFTLLHVDNSFQITQVIHLASHCGGTKVGRTKETLGPEAREGWFPNTFWEGERFTALKWQPKHTRDMAPGVMSTVRASKNHRHTQPSPLPPIPPALPVETPKSVEAAWLTLNTRIMPWTEEVMLSWSFHCFTESWHFFQQPQVRDVHKGKLGRCCCWVPGKPLWQIPWKSEEF